MNAQAGRKGISTDEEYNGTGLQNHCSWSTCILQPEAPILKLVGVFFVFFLNPSYTFCPLRNIRSRTNSIEGWAWSRTLSCCCEVLAF